MEPRAEAGNGPQRKGSDGVEGSGLRGRDMDWTAAEGGEMPYLAFDLEALEKAPNVARAAHVTEEMAIAGMARMWKHCWHEKVDRVDVVMLEGFFGQDVSRALVSFGFLEPAEDGFRVRGAERYLRLHMGQRKGGRKSKGNLIPGPHKRTKVLTGSDQSQPEASRGGMPEVDPEKASGSLPALAGEDPENASGSSPALTPSTDHLIETDHSLTRARARAKAQTEQLAPGLVRFETARQRHFNTPGLPITAPPDFENRFKGLLEGHRGDEDWALETYAHFWEDPWAGRLRPPGSLSVFLRPDQWPKHIQPKQGVNPDPQSQPELTDAEKAWAAVLELLRDAGKSYAVHYLEQFKADEIVTHAQTGRRVLWLKPPDPFAAAWVRREYGAMLDETIEGVLGPNGKLEFIADAAEQGAL